MKIKKFFVVGFLTFLLSSCGTSTETSTISTTSKYDKNQYFAITIPTTWEILGENDFTKPKKGKVDLAARSTSEISGGFSNNIVIISDKLTTATTSKKYSIVNYTLSTGEYVDFVKVSEKNIKFSDGDESAIYIFEAKYNTNSVKRKFIQSAKVCTDRAFLMTIGIDLKITDTSKYEDLIKSFECKKK
ncbi:MAG: hypothetical protein PHO80_03370 [Candidatus Gracilibacteria bacterium]|nr:hypothetical protein [Candidatus Gracilibacteria bacterium]